MKMVSFKLEHIRDKHDLIHLVIFQRAEQQRMKIEFFVSSVRAYQHCSFKSMTL